MTDIFHTHIQDHGRVVVPAAVRKALGLKRGDPVVIEPQDDGFRVRSFAHVLRALQAAVAAHIPPGVSLADELIVERRAEAAREAAGE